MRHTALVQCHAGFQPGPQTVRATQADAHVPRQRLGFLRKIRTRYLQTNGGEANESVLISGRSSLLIKKSTAEKDRYMRDKKMPLQEALRASETARPITSFLQTLVGKTGFEIAYEHPPTALQPPERVIPLQAAILAS